MNENAYVVAMATVIAAGVLGLVGILVAGGTHSDRKIAEMVEHGADPIAAHCAISPDYLCMEWAALRKVN